MSFEHRFEHLVFDLDDTLLDTFKQLVPRATREACRAMIEAGLDTDLETAMQEASKQGSSPSRHDLFERLVAKFGIRAGASKAAVIGRGSTAFYNREVENDITLFPGVTQMLASLKDRYKLHLVTAGHRPTQEAKIRILGLEKIFSSISHVDPSLGETKRQAFARLMQLHPSPPEKFLSVGNRIDTDIAEARELGWRGCWVRYGEYAGRKPAKPVETPEFEIDRIEELAEKCHL